MLHMSFPPSASIYTLLVQTFYAIFLLYYCWLYSWQIEKAQQRMTDTSSHPITAVNVNNSSDKVTNAMSWLPQIVDRAYSHILAHHMPLYCVSFTLVSIAAGNNATTNNTENSTVHLNGRQRQQCNHKQQTMFQCCPLVGQSEYMPYSHQLCLVIMWKCIKRQVDK